MLKVRKHKKRLLFIKLQDGISWKVNEIWWYISLMLEDEWSLPEKYTYSNSEDISGRNDNLYVTFESI